MLAFLIGNAEPVFPTQSAATADIDGVLNQYCVTCHDQDGTVAGLALDTLDAEHVEQDAEIWEKVVRKIKTGMMPPGGAPRPERRVLDSLAFELETRLDRAAANEPNPGAPILHRLNRVEYANVIRDLLALDVDATTLLPADDSNEGFDNIADALGVSPSLIQGYVSAAMKISRRAVGDQTLMQSRVTYNAPVGLSQEGHLDGLPLGTRGGMIVRHTFPLDAEYQFAVGGGTFVMMDGEQITAANLRNFRLPIKAGPHTIAVAIVDQRRASGVDDSFSDFRVDSDFAAGGGAPSVSITGPLDAVGPGDTPSRRKIFVCYPESAAQELSCAREIVMTLTRRAFRRPALDGEVQELMAFYDRGRKEGDFETGIQHALARILVAPRFLFRMEDEPATVSAEDVYRVADLALASRLSFFLWSSMPDDELLDVAVSGRLSDPAILEGQVRRMLRDPKSRTLIDNFAGQWLYLRELAGVQTEAKEFDANLRQAFRRETEMLFDGIVREDRSLMDLLDANYTFVDERLARHYGIPDVRGSYFRRVELAENSPRRGILGHGSMLTVTSVATRTSPVMRGKWILANLMGAPPPDPPPGVETNLDEDPEAAKVSTLRQRLELHRANDVCASCHNVMDPVGLALENFDLIGKWREQDGDAPIDAEGILVDGTTLSGPADVRKALLDRSEAFMTTVTEKLLMYAVGRPVEYYDMPAVRSIVRAAAQNDNRFSSVVLGIVRSAPFQMKIKK
jgi:hypothetical protein